MSYEIPQAPNQNMPADPQNVRITGDSHMTPAPQEPKLPEKKSLFAKLKAIPGKVADSIGAGSGAQRVGVQVGIVVAIVLAVLLLIGIVFGIIKAITAPPPPPQVVIGSPGPVSTPGPQPVRDPSPYAEDEEVLSIISEIDRLEKEAQEIDLTEDLLGVPRLDWVVTFE